MRAEGSARLAANYIDPSQQESAAQDDMNGTPEAVSSNRACPLASRRTNLPRRLRAQESAAALFEMPYGL